MLYANPSVLDYFDSSSMGDSSTDRADLTGMGRKENTIANVADVLSLLIKVRETIGRI